MRASPGDTAHKNGTVASQFQRRQLDGRGEPTRRPIHTLLPDDLLQRSLESVPELINTKSPNSPEFPQRRFQNSFSQLPNAFFHSGLYTTQKIVQWQDSTVLDT